MQGCLKWLFLIFDKASFPNGRGLFQDDNTVHIELSEHMLWPWSSKHQMGDQKQRIFLSLFYLSSFCLFLKETLITITNMDFDTIIWSITTI